MASNENLPQAPPAMVDLSATHAGRHPSQPVIPPRNPPAAKKLSADKEARRLAKELADSRNREFNDGLTALQDHMESKIEELAEQHSKKAAYVKSLLYQQTSYKLTRKENTNNARIHLKSLEMNAGELRWS
jgi:hypothetical protein